MSATTEIGEQCDLFDPQSRANPYPIYHRLRSEDPVYWSEAWGGWLLTRYSDITSVLRDPRLSAADGLNPLFDRLPRAEQEALLPLRRHVSMWMGNLDPPDHTRIRSLMHRAFTPRLIESIRSFAQAVTDELIDGVQGAGRMDVVRDFAYPLPAIVIGRMLGSPERDMDLLYKWSDSIASFLGYGFLFTDVMWKAQETVSEMTEYLRGLVKDRRENGLQNDLISSFIAAEQQGHLIEEEILANCVLLLFAAHETTGIFLANGVLALIQNRGELEKLSRDPALIPRAVDECLRYDCPVQMIRRFAKEDVEIGGKKIKKGEATWAILGAANRDPERFPVPDRFDIARADNHHVGFGFGAHFCLGEALACIEGEVAFGTFFKRLPNLRLAAPALEWVDNPTARALKSLPVSFDPS